MLYNSRNKKGDILIKKIGFLFFLFFAQISIVIAENLTLDEDTQELICVTTINSLEGIDICINEKIDPERLAVCAQYTVSYISEALCLKKRKLKYEKIMACYLTDTVLEEQICLLYPNSYDSVIRELSDSEKYSNALKTMETEMEELLGFIVNFDMSILQFDFLDNSFNQDEYDEYHDYNQYDQEQKPFLQDIIDAEEGISL